MIIKDIFISPSREEFGIDISYKFRCHTAKFCTFLERYIKPHKIRAPYFRISFTGRKEMQNTKLLSNNVLVVNFILDIDEYLSKEHDGYDAYFTRLLRQSIIDYDQKYDLPTEILYSGIKQFEDSQFVNEWELARKRLQCNKNYFCSTQCRVDFDKFTITMKIEDKNSNTIESRVIYSEAPDVFVFGYYLKKDFIQTDNKLIFIDKIGNPFFTYELPGEIT